MVALPYQTAMALRLYPRAGSPTSDIVPGQLSRARLDCQYGEALYAYRRDARVGCWPRGFRLPASRLGVNGTSYDLQPFRLQFNR